ncbi:MAG: chemotaxis protein [Desulfovibrio sp.]|nr:chemotaxis protein [Desulfovibrio sp.]
MHTNALCRTALALALAFALAALPACGPKEIGAGSSVENREAGGGAPSAELMRYPMTGASPRERMLYLNTRPDIVQQVQDWRIRSYQRMMGVQPSPEDPAYRAVPKQRSPFRQ